MIFQYTVQKVLEGVKTQTRRLEGSDDRWKGENLDDVWAVHLGPPTYRTRWERGKSYAVQSGRGVKACGRITIMRIHYQRLQEITEEEARAEGCDSADTAPDEFARLWDSIHKKQGQRWADNPPVWVIEFKLERGNQR